MLQYQNLLTLCYPVLTSILLKMKHMRQNDCDYLTKKLRNAITSRSNIRDKPLKTRTEESKRHFDCQGNFRASLLRKTKGSFLEKLDHRVFSNNRKA